MMALAHYGNGELGNTYATLWAGVPRVTFSFFAGVLCFRLHSEGRLIFRAVSPLVLAFFLVALLAVPHNMPWTFDALCIFGIFPLILIATKNVEPDARWAPIARFSADLSYPLYLFHLPLILWIGFVLSHWGVSTPIQHLSQLIAIPLLAYAAHTFLDRPLQIALKARFRTIPPQAAPIKDPRPL